MTSSSNYARKSKRKNAVPWLPEKDAEGHTFDPNDRRHGSANGYTNHGCRCRRCTEAWRVAHRSYMHADPDRLRRHAERARRRREASQTA